MTLRIPFAPEMEVKLRDLATAEGKDLASVVLEAVEEKLALAGETGVHPGASKLSAQRRIAELRAWAASHAPLPYGPDDSRESIYEGHGE